MVQSLTLPEPTSSPENAEEIELPRGATIGAIVRTEADGRSRVIIAHHDTQIESDDHVIVFLANKRSLAQVEKLFQVGVRFF